jgi:hypothetical protein
VIRFLRQLRAPRYALAVVVCQLAVLCSSTITLAASPRSGTLAVGAAEACSCDHTAGVMCPMHRKSSARPAPTNGPRWCKGADGAAFAVLPSLGALAMPERLVELVLSFAESAAPVSSADAPRLLARPPDSPPPRA